MDYREPTDGEASQAHIDDLLKGFFAAELPNRLPPLPGRVAHSSRHLKWRAGAAALVALAASFTVLVWVSRPPAPHPAASTPGIEDVVAFEWKTSTVVEPYSGEQIELNLPQVTMNVPSGSISTFPNLNEKP